MINIKLRKFSEFDRYLMKDHIKEYLESKKHLLEKYNDLFFTTERRGDTAFLHSESVNLLCNDFDIHEHCLCCEDTDYYLYFYILDGDTKIHSTNSKVNIGMKFDNIYHFNHNLKQKIDKLIINDILKNKIYKFIENEENNKLVKNILE